MSAPSGPRTARIPGHALARLACLLAIAGLAGCAGPQPPTYQSVRREFAAPAAQAVTAPDQPAQAPDLSAPLDLRRAVRLALTHSPGQEMALMRIRQSEAMLDQALAAFLPMLSLYSEFSRGDVPSGYLFKTIDQRLLPPNTNFNGPGTFQNWESGVRARWNLFHGGQDYLRRQMAQQGVEISRLDRQALENSLVASVIKAYYNCLAAGDFSRIAEQAEATVAAQLRTMEVRQKGGGALLSDVLSLRVRLAQAREDLVRARNTHRLALAALANLLGGDPDSELDLVEGEGVEATVPPLYREGVVEALERRPELAKVRRQVVSARLALAAARAEYLPRVDAQGVYSWDDPLAQYSGERANYSYGLLVNWDVFTGLSTVKGAEKAKAALREVLAADRQAGLNIQLDVKSAYLNLAESLARLEVGRANLMSAEEAHRLVKRQYEGGAADVTRYLDAELNLNGARVRAAAAEQDARKARADIARALGLWTPRAAKELGRDD